MIKLKYLVTGTGRSGTVFMARLLTSVGIACGHECIFDWRGIRGAKMRLGQEIPIELSFVSKHRVDNGKFIPLADWINIDQLQAESSYLAAPFLDDEIFSETKIIHVVRNPIKVVNSFCNYMHYFEDGEGKNGYEQLIYRVLPSLKNDMPQYDRACLFYVEWNKMIEEHHPGLFFRVEDDVTKVFDFLKIKPTTYFTDSTINSWKKPSVEQFNLNKIESSEIKSQFCDIMKKYGYRESNNLWI